MAKDLTGPNAAGHELGDIVAVGMRPAGGGRVALVEPPKPGEPTMRWVSHAHSIDEIESELARIRPSPTSWSGRRTSGRSGTSPPAPR